MTSPSKIHYYRKVNGKAVPQSGEKPLRDVVLNYLSVFKEGTLFQFIMRPYKEKRSNKQNRYMHFVFNLIEKETGQDAKTIKNTMKDKFMEDEFVEFKGIKLKKEKHTSDLNTEQQELFMNKVRKFWFEEFDGFIIPLPNEIDLEE